MHNSTLISDVPLNDDLSRLQVWLDETVQEIAGREQVAAVSQIRDLATRARAADPGLLERLAEEGIVDKRRRRWYVTRSATTATMREQPAIEQAGETLQTLGQEWASAPKRYRRDMWRRSLAQGDLLKRSA